MISFVGIVSCKQKTEKVMPELSFDIDSVLSNKKEDPILKISEYLNKLSSYGDDLSVLSESQKVFLFVDNLEMEVNNGGINQFFYNSSGAYAHETLEALKKIKAYEMAAILEEGISLWPDKKVPKSEIERREFLVKSGEHIDTIIHKLDERYYKYPDQIGVLLIEYIKNNKKDFQ
jgi:hypothetical protein